MTSLIVNHPGWEQHLHIDPVSNSARCVSVCCSCTFGFISVGVHLYACLHMAVLETLYGLNRHHKPPGRLFVCIKRKRPWPGWMTASSVLITNSNSDAGNHLTRTCPPPAVAHKPRRTSRLARLKLMPIGLLFRQTLRKVFQDPVRILLTM